MSPFYADFAYYFKKISFFCIYFKKECILSDIINEVIKKDYERIS